MLDQTLGDESAGERNEASNIGTADVVTGSTVLFGGPSRSFCRCCPWDSSPMSASGLYLG